MKKKSRMARSILVLCLLVAAALLVVLPAYAGTAEKVSMPGEYSGYSAPIYDDWERVSQYVTVQEGTEHETKLAVDIFFPKKDGVLFYEKKKAKLPLIWTHYIYHRASTLSDDTVITQVDMNPWLQEVIKHGYVVGVVDYRGGGASYGTRPGPFSQIEARDTYEITEWFAEQKWCNGNIGMFGRSVMGITQYMCAGMAPPHLKCIFPEMSMFDLYSFVYAGGVFHYEFIGSWNWLVKAADLNLPGSPFPPAAPVDDDTNEEQLSEAISEHWGNYDIFEIAANAPYRDSVDELWTGEQCYFTRSPSAYLTGVRDSGVAVYHLGGWFDMWPRDTVLWYNNLDNPQKITIGPWCHMAMDDYFLAAEHLRWYDYWLKDIENGVMDEPPFCYYTMGAPESKEWRFAHNWPLHDELQLSFYFREGKTGSVKSVNDGFLELTSPQKKVGKDKYTVDYTTTTGLSNRWTNGYGGPFGYPDMTENDEKGLTYTTHPLSFDVEVTGHPVLHLWVTSTAADGDFFVYLEEVDGEGISHYITEGTLRASHRTTMDSPFEYMGLPWHRSFEEDVSELPSKPVELVFDLHPTSNIFDAGHRIRVTITCADQGNFLTPELSPLPKVTVYRNDFYTSHINLPCIWTVDDDDDDDDD